MIYNEKDSQSFAGVRIWILQLIIAKTLENNMALGNECLPNEFRFLVRHPIYK